MLTAPDGSPISSFCFGAMQFGRGADQSAAQAMYAECRAAGINFFDTAHGYSGGLSEEWLGRLVRHERDCVFFATKLAAQGGSGRVNIENQFRLSQQRHGLESVDLLYLHRWDPETPLQETFEALAGLKAAGKIRHIGVSNFAAWQVMKSVRVAADFGLRIDAIQPMYNLVKREAETEILPMAQDQGIAVFPYSPLGGGLLTGKYRDGGQGRLTTDQVYSARYGESWMHDTAAALCEVAHEVGHSSSTLAVAWVAANPAVTAPIISARSLEQLEQSLRAMGLKLGKDLHRRISALSRAPASATDRSEDPSPFAAVSVVE